MEATNNNTNKHNLFSNLNSYLQTKQQALQNPNKYWDEIAKTLVWQKPYTIINNSSFNLHNIQIKWFEDGQLNMAYNCINAHLPHNANKNAFVFINNDLSTRTAVTYVQLHVNVNKYSNMLIELGVKQGDVVTIYLPTCKEAIYTMLACANIGAVHSVVFTGFAPTALAERINDANSKFLITASHALRGAKELNLKEIVDKTIPMCANLQKIVINNTNNANISNSSLYVNLNNVLANASSNFTPVVVNAEHPLFILYTSGSTAKPKGLVHSTGGYAVYSKHTFGVNFNYSPTDIYFCTADIGWITGHSYVVYGPLLNCATTIVYEGLPLYPTPSSYWQVCEQEKVNIFYTAPTAIRSLLNYDVNKYVAKYNLNSLKVIATVGEPINLEAWEWFYTNIGKNRCALVDTWWQTETGGHIITCVPHVTFPKPTYAGQEFFGIKAVILDDNKKVLPDGELGALCLCNSWPGQARTIINNHQLFINTYFSAYAGYYFSGDEAIKSSNGDIRILGRKDDVINVSGHRISSANLEDVVNMHPNIAESAAVGVEDAIKGFEIVVFCSLNKSTHNYAEIPQEAIDLLRNKIGPIATPKKIIIVPDLPKTRSGKIMRRILRKIANQDYTNFGDTSTLANPEIVNTIVNVVKGGN